MERKLSFDEVKKAVEEAFEQYKSVKEGTVDERVAAESDADTFSISLTLTDGRTFDKGNTNDQVAIGSVVKVPLSLVLLSQSNGQENCKCGCACSHDNKKVDIEMPFGRHGLRAVSAVEPAGDPDGKFKVVSDMIYSLTGSEQGFSDSLYSYYTAKIKEDNVAENLKNSGCALADDAAQSLDVYARLLSLKLSVRQLSTMGATVAADGRNPLNGEYAFDGTLSAPAVALMASRGKHFAKKWMLRTGMPAKKSFTGAMLAVLPGFGAIAAYSPRLNDCEVPVKAAKAIAYIASKLNLNVYSSARVSVEK